MLKIILVLIFVVINYAVVPAALFCSNILQTSAVVSQHSARHSLF